MDNIIQIGINKWAEYLHVLGLEELVKDCKRVPPNVISSDDIVFYGVDTDRDDLLLDKYPKFKDHPNVRWVCCKIIPSWHNTYTGITKSVSIASHGRARVSLDDLIRYLEIDSLSILAVDIEGWEFDVFEDYSWHLLPKLLNIEMHPCVDSEEDPVKLKRRSLEDVIAFENFIIQKGYKIIGRWLPGHEIHHFIQEPSADGYECVFLREDLDGN